MAYRLRGRRSGTGRRDPARARAAGRRLRLYLLLAAAMSGLYSVVLTLVPGRVVLYEAGAAGAGLLLALLALGGLAVDVIVGRLVARFGARAVLWSGILVLAAGASLLFAVRHMASLVGSVAALGIGLGLLGAPILGGLASAAAENQVKAQALNAVWQRIGGLVAAVFLARVLVSADDWLAAGAVALLLVTLAAATASLRRTDQGQTGRAGAGEEVRRPADRLVATVRGSPLLGAGVTMNVATAILLIVGSSFYPLVLVEMRMPELLVPGLVGREALGIVAVVAARVIGDRARLDRLWVGCAVVGTATLLAMPLVSAPLAVVVLFSLQGPATSLAILLGNVRTFDGTTPHNRLIGYAACMVSMRVSSIAVPLVLGLVVEVSAHLAMAVAGLGLLAVVVAYVRLVVRARSVRSNGGG